MRIKLRAQSVGLVLLLCVMAGCAGLKTQTPQYQAAVGINDFAIALAGAQQLEISIHQAGAIDADLHKTIQTVFLQAAQNGKLADKAVAVGDLTTAKSYFSAAVKVLQGLTPQMVGIKNPTSQQAFEAALTVAINIAQTWATQLNSTPAKVATIEPGPIGSALSHWDDDGAPTFCAPSMIDSFGGCYETNPLRPVTGVI